MQFQYSRSLRTTATWSRFTPSGITSPGLTARSAWPPRWPAGCPRHFGSSLNLFLQQMYIFTRCISSLHVYSSEHVLYKRRTTTVDQCFSFTCPSATDVPLASTIQTIELAAGLARTSQRMFTLLSPRYALVGQQRRCGATAITTTAAAITTTATTVTIYTYKYTSQTQTVNCRQRNERTNK